MSSMLKSLSITALLASSLFATPNVDKTVTEFQTKRLNANPQIKLENLSIFIKKELPQKGWYGYVFDIKANLNGQIVEAKDTIFSDGVLVAPELLDIKTGRSFKDMLTPTMTNDYYNDSHLIVGNKNAKNKVVVFSDPLCKFCVEYIPMMLRDVAKSKDIALYYYHFPLLRIHPAADVVTRAMIVAKKQGIKDVEKKIYEADLLDMISTKESNEQVILDTVNKVLQTKITLAQINDAKVKQELEDDMKKADNMMIQGTPTVFVNGIMDRNRQIFEGLVK
ncbi:DsbA family protein [Arcobacter sp. FWKO B]|uniref:DsbA family protein n=1 Tax=Arcobacter sp. FWKO B TaxID=2593672 RepID=UPI0018A38C0B|nr:thioredoxin domain-containing protein [Arcobacter sp. FWKO B]QOG11949.1 DsbA family protein [Arcobacter sp. FWKO B]